MNKLKKKKTNHIYSIKITTRSILLKIPAPLAVLEIEAKAMETTVLFTLEMGFNEVTLEMNSLTLCRVLSGLTEPPSSIETIAASILSLVQCFSIFSFSHVKRQGNKPAHILAQFA